MTLKIAYPPRIDFSLSKPGDAILFTTLNLGSVFSQVLLWRQYCNKTCFASGLVFTNGRGSPSSCAKTYHRFMAQTLTSVKMKYGNFIIFHVDYVLIVKLVLRNRIDEQDALFNCMKRAEFKPKPSNCEILKDTKTIWTRRWTSMV